MSTASARIREDHRNAAKLLRLLERETSHLRSGEYTDFHLVADIMHYFVYYPDRYHHPLEDRMFEALKAKNAGVAREVEQIAQEHHDMGEAGQHLLDRAVQIQGNAVFSREDLVNELQDYVDGYWKHMRMEEDVLLPSADAVLEESDWRKVEAEFELEEDPLFGRAVREQYQQLFQAILSGAGSDDAGSP